MRGSHSRSGNTRRSRSASTTPSSSVAPTPTPPWAVTPTRPSIWPTARFIAVFSCYRQPEASPPRKLVFASKASDGERASDGETFEIPLAHNGVVAFSVDLNRRIRHKIVLDAPGRAVDNEWLG